MLSNITRKAFLPEKEEILEGINMVIKYCRDNSLRKQIVSLIVDRDFVKKTKAVKWYGKLSNNHKKAFNNYIPRAITQEELKQIVNIEKIDCSGNLLIDDLVPISYLEEVQEINFSSTSVLNIEPLKNLKNLNILSLNHTYVSSLEPIYDIENIKVIKCFQSKLNDQEIERLMIKNPKCQVVLNPLGQ